MNIVGINQNDVDILDRLFTMYDKTGDDIIVYKDFLAGISPLISGTHNDKIEFSFRMLDLGNFVTTFDNSKSLVKINACLPFTYVQMVQGSSERMTCSIRSLR